jgi:hypothetical protein
MFTSLIVFNQLFVYADDGNKEHWDGIFPFFRTQIQIVTPFHQLVQCFLRPPRYHLARTPSKTSKFMASASF